MKSANRKKADDYSRISTCYHESSHAIIAINNYFKVTQLQALSEEGFCKIECFSNINLFHNKSVINRIAILEAQVYCAGMEGEKLYRKDICGCTKFPRVLYGAYDDVQRISALIKQFNLAEPGYARTRFKVSLQSKTNKFLQEHWLEVKALAHSLYKRKTISFDDIKKILLKINKPFWKEKFDNLDILSSQELWEEKELIELGFI